MSLTFVVSHRLLTQSTWHQLIWYWNCWWIQLQLLWSHWWLEHQLRRCLSPVMLLLELVLVVGAGGTLVSAPPPTPLEKVIRVKEVLKLNYNKANQKARNKRNKWKYFNFKSMGLLLKVINLSFIMAFGPFGGITQCISHCVTDDRANIDNEESAQA